MTADLVVPTVDGVFSYRVPASMQSNAHAGMRALVPFGHRRVTGFIVDIKLEENEHATKSIECLLDSTPVFSPELLNFTKWIADYYLCGWGDALKAALPAGFTLDEKAYWVLDGNSSGEEWALFFETHEVEKKLVKALRAAPISLVSLKRRFGLTARSVEIKRLQQAGLISFRPVIRPPRVKSKMDAVLTLTDKAKQSYGEILFTQIKTVNGQRLIREIFESGPDGVLRSYLLKGANSSRRAALAKLIFDGWIQLRVEEVNRWESSQEISPQVNKPLTLTNDQIAILKEIYEPIEQNRFQSFLLHGVTGSGKTQVYIEAISKILERGKTALVLVPEITLTPFLWSRFRDAFGDQVAIQHSGQSPSVRFDLWRAIRAGKFPVVIGARSAVFAPLKNIGIVIVDEEHESGLKQTESPPRYHARDAALVRARMHHAVAILGSATPSLESMFLAQTHRHTMLSLPDRIGGVAMPTIVIEKTTPDPEEENEERSKKKKSASVEPPPILTPKLIEHIHEVLRDNKQAILLQNRRGFAPFVVCKTCGHIPLCEQCSVSMTYHRRGRVLRCHYCNASVDAPDQCLKCGSSELIMYGIGTQRLEEELEVHFPDARILRMDSDSVSRPGAHGKMIAAFAAHDYDILLGTQMIAKGLDFPHVQLAAVVQAETELFHPDFRATERGAGLILQLAGRAGRRDLQGKVIVQCSIDQHPALRAAVSGDWVAFTTTELATRLISSFPPYARLILIRAAAKDESSVARSMIRIKNLLSVHDSLSIMGPAPAVISKLKNKYRYQLIARTTREQDPAGKILRTAVQSALNEYKQSRTEPSVALEIDVDPQSIT
jgi:primosomal protein N' (replication factor Y)